MKRGGPAGGMQGGMANLMKQANQLQMKMKKLQDELAERESEASSGGNAVTVKVKGILFKKVAVYIFLKTLISQCIIPAECENTGLY